MYLLIGITESISQTFIGGDFESSFEKEPVACFSTLEKLEEYTKQYKLNKPIIKAWNGTINFHKDSVLAGCIDFEYVEISSLPVDPV